MPSTEDMSYTTERSVPLGKCLDYTAQFVQEFHCWVSLCEPEKPEGAPHRTVQQVHFHILVCERLVPLLRADLQGLDSEEVAYRLALAIAGASQRGFRLRDCGKIELGIWYAHLSLGSPSPWWKQLGPAWTWWSIIWKVAAKEAYWKFLASSRRDSSPSGLWNWATGLLASRWHSIRCWGYLCFPVETVGWSWWAPTVEPLSLKFGSYSLYSSLSGQFVSLLALCIMAFLEFEFDLYAWLFFEFVDVPQWHGICRAFMHVIWFVNIPSMVQYLHGIWRPFRTFSITVMIWVLHQSAVFGYFVYGIEFSAVLMTLLYLVDLPYWCICRIDESAVLQLWAFCIMRLTECHSMCIAVYRSYCATCVVDVFNCMDETCIRLRMYRCAKLQMDELWIQLICPREKWSA